MLPTNYMTKATDKERKRYETKRERERKKLAQKVTRDV